MYLIKFIPFHKSRLIDWNEIEKLEVVKYDPIGDYGGWGIKSKKGKKAYNVSGFNNDLNHYHLPTKNGTTAFLFS